MIKNIFREMELAKIPRTEAEIKAVYQDCCGRCWIAVCGMNYVAMSEMEKVLDMIEGSPLDRHGIRRFRKQYERQMESYNRKVMTHLADSYPLWFDFMNEIYRKVEPLTRNLTLAFKFVLDKNMQENTLLKAQMETAYIMTRDAEKFFVDFFNVYKSHYGIDFSPDFRTLHLVDISYSVKRLMQEICVSRHKIEFGDYQRCKDCYNAIDNYMGSENFFNEAGEFALRLNSEKYKDYIDQLDKEKKERESEELGLGRLAEKYKVVN
ncbi:MAG: hypothetical protein LKE41_00905 [Prevotella sp.]|jgi:RNA polymerase-binding transcription factor DksA|nr:hypothetical protein [Prevotella sp.]